MQPWVIVVIILAALVFIGFTLAALTFKVAFNRCDPNPLLKYFTAEDFNLSAERVRVKHGGIPLGGFIYRDERAIAKDGLIVFQHGMGAGHLAYTTEIAYFCSLGYPVLALDIRGCNFSEGKSSKGMYEGVKCVKTAIDFARSDDRFKNSKIYLVGHSWGGYSVICASAERKVDKVVAISSPVSPVKTLYNGAEKLISKPLALMLCPFWYALNFLLFGAKGNASVVNCVKKSGAPTLIIHGDNDTIVPLKRSAYGRTCGENVEKYLSYGKSHNPYNSCRAQGLVAELDDRLTGIKKLTEEDRKYFAGFDFSAATEEDGEVMGKIADFLSK